ncbi:aminodeoxychorismate lyase [Cytobacillus sp. Hz8]|uniref:aminodeoxychorismate lyase n=1 Tax=Cytobacillus sp. Hz8 TaxID=3347168 RepID=UPI0035DDBD5F
MNAKLISSFAAGLLLSSTVLGAVYLSDVEGATNKSSKTKVVEPSEKEMKDKLTTAGYMIYTKDELNKILKSTKSEAVKKEDSNSKTDSKSEDTGKEKIIYRTFLSVSKGMTSYDVGKVLVRSKIVDNAFDFSKRVEKKGLANNLRPGTYRIDSDMTEDEVIAVVFKK